MQLPNLSQEQSCARKYAQLVRLGCKFTTWLQRVAIHLAWVSCKINHKRKTIEGVCAKKEAKVT